MRSTLALPLILTLCCSSVACGDSGSAGSETTDDTASAELRHDVSCIDESFAQLGLFEEPNPAKVFNDPVPEEGFETEVDATAGDVSPTESFVYLKFEDDGLNRVDISDDDAFDSLDWDIAIRRYIIRLNSGVSGPGEVKAARTKPNTSFDGVDSVPDGLDFRVEKYFSEDCTFVGDGGIGGPATALASFWAYEHCVKMTHNVYVIEVARPKTRHVKLEVMAYYPRDRQQMCEETGTVASPSGAGRMLLRWAYFD